MEKFEIKKLPNGRYYINIYQGDEENILLSNGFTFDKNELQILYIKLREIFTSGNKE